MNRNQSNFQSRPGFWQQPQPTQPNQQPLLPLPFGVPFIVVQPLLPVWQPNMMHWCEASSQEYYRAPSWGPTRSRGHQTAAPLHLPYTYESSGMIGRDRPSGIHPWKGVSHDNSGTGGTWTPPSANASMVDTMRLNPYDRAARPLTRDRVIPSTYKVPQAIRRGARATTGLAAPPILAPAAAPPTSASAMSMLAPLTSAPSTSGALRSATSTLIQTGSSQTADEDSEITNEQEHTVEEDPSDLESEISLGSDSD